MNRTHNVHIPALPVANHAIPGSPNRKMAARLSSRRADFSLLINSKNPESSKKEQHKANGGYHRPGSMQK